MDNNFEHPAASCWSEKPIPETVPLMASSSVEAASAADSMPSSLAHSSRPSQIPPVNQQYPTLNPLEMANQYLPPAVPCMVYPQPYALTPPGQPYSQTCYATPQTGYMYLSPPLVNYYYGPQQPLPPQQQQQQVVYVNSQQIPVLKPVVQMNGAIVLSCYVFWCCGMVFGGIAFILAMVGFGESDEGNTEVAKRCRTASYAVSLIGLAAGIVLILIFILLLLAHVH